MRLETTMMFNNWPKLPSPLFIFDLDGTLALIEHRISLASAGNWDRFYKECVFDKPNMPIILLARMLEDQTNEIWIFTGRSEIVKPETMRWLDKHAQIGYTQLRMREKGDFTDSATLKENWFRAMSEYDKNRLVAVFDDRNKDAAMWRANGVTCLQVANNE